MSFFHSLSLFLCLSLSLSLSPSQAVQKQKSLVKSPKKFPETFIRSLSLVKNDPRYIQTSEMIRKSQFTTSNKLLIHNDNTKR